MIPADVASQLRLLTPEQPAGLQPVTPAKAIADAISDLLPGQRIMAEIQALLPNGTYRAIVAQREIHLSLPFSAKPGDSLELEVVDTDGNIALAFVANRTSGEQARSAPRDSVSTTLSQAGKLIGDLLGGVDEQGKRAAPAPLNGNQPLLENTKIQATDLAPILKEALTKSGVFYEAHQARWVAGDFTADALRQEPQGKATAVTVEARQASSGVTTTQGQPERTVASHQATPQAGVAIPRDLAPIVQQQLDALATQNYAWQGQIWPGQKMWWEISEDSDQSRSASDESNGNRWQTRLKLSLPLLGGVDAVLRLSPGGNIDISVTADSQSSEVRLQENATSLKESLEAAGINLNQFLVGHGEETS